MMKIKKVIHLKDDQLNWFSVNILRILIQQLIEKNR